MVIGLLGENLSARHVHRRGETDGGASDAAVLGAVMGSKANIKGNLLGRDEEGRSGGPLEGDGGGQKGGADREGVQPYAEVLKNSGPDAGPSVTNGQNASLAVLWDAGTFEDGAEPEH